MITGHFVSVDIPQVPPGEDIIATIDFYAINPGAWYWATFLIADIPALGVQRLLDKAREVGEEGGRQKTYNLGRMPDGNVAISLFLFAHDDAAYDWSWGEYYVWLDGYPVEVTHLDSEYVLLTPGVPPEEYLGTITRGELEYNGDRKPIPAANIPIGVDGLVHIWGRNNTGTAQQMGVIWEVKDPDGIVIEAHSEWEAWPYTGAGGEHEFIGGRFPLDKLGTYTLFSGLLMNPDSPVYVDFMIGDLCTVVPEFVGAITKVEFEYDGTKRTAPVDDVPMDDRGLVHVLVLNNTGETQRMGIRWEVHDPLGRLVDSHDEWETWPYTAPYGTHEFIGGRFDLVEQGDYTIGVTLWMNPDAPVAADTYSGRLCAVGVEVPPPPPCEQYQTEEECVAAGCYWYDNSCHSIPEEEVVKKFPWLPVALISGGAVVVAVAAKPKKVKP